MKKIIFILTVVFTIVACATSEERAARQAENLKMVKSSVGNQRYRINVTSMTPLRGMRTTVMGRYLKVDGSRVDCSLPYAGRDDIPHMKTHGELRMDSRIEFRGEAQKYKLQYQPQKKRGVITFTITDRGEDYKFNIVVDELGQARIHMEPQNRDNIDYEGDVNSL